MSRKLDADIAEALGREVNRCVNGHYGTLHETTEEGSCWREYDWRPVPDYSTDGTAMLELDREMRKKCYKRFMFADSDFFTVTYIGSYTEMGSCFVRTSKATAENMPLAVALAAYKALTGKGWIRKCEG